MALTNEYVDTGFNVKYSQDSLPTDSIQQDLTSSTSLKLNILQTSTDSIVPSSVNFTMGGKEYYDSAGSIYVDRDQTTGIGTLSGTINYDTGEVELTTYDSISDQTITVSSCYTKDGDNEQTGYVFRTPGSPVRDGSFSMRANDIEGALYTAQAETNGGISDTKIEGKIDTSVGVVRVDFGEMVVAAGNESEDWYNEDWVDEGMIWKPHPVIPETSLYNAVLYASLPLDEDLIGIEPIRLPTDGRVPIFKSGNVAVLHHSEDEAIGASFTNGQIIALSRSSLSIVDLFDYQGNLVDESFYTVDLTIGQITVVDDAGLNALTDGNTQNILAKHRIEDMVLLSEAQINGYCSVVGVITHDYPAIGAQCSSALIFGDLVGRVVRLFHQKTWDNIWRDEQYGDSSIAKYDTLNYPFLITNDGSSDQRWVLKFTSTNTVDVIGETFGVIIEDASILSAIAPINPATGKAYFYVDPAGWGGGWVSGNNVRFDTSASNSPVWIARTTMQGAVEEPTDNFVMQIRGDAN